MNAPDGQREINEILHLLAPRSAPVILRGSKLCQVEWALGDRAFM